MKEKKKYWLIALIVGVTVFIWANSMVNRENSAQLSGGFTAWLQSVLDIQLTEHFIRKAAHFCEYAVLGFLYGILFRQGRKNGQWVFNFASIGLMTAVADESIQIVSGRGPMVSDVLLDFCGFDTGFAAALLLSLLFFSRKRVDGNDAA